MPVLPLDVRWLSGCTWKFHRDFPWSWQCERRIGRPPCLLRNTRYHLQTVVPWITPFHLLRQVFRHGRPVVVYPLCTKFANFRPVARQSDVLARCPRPGSVSMLEPRGRIIRFPDENNFKGTLYYIRWKFAHEPDEFKRIATLMVFTDSRRYEYIILYGENAQRSIPVI